MALSKVEALFLAAPVAVFGIFVFGAANSPTEAGPRMRGEISSCLGRGRSTPRQCFITIGPRTTVLAQTPFGKTGDVVTVTKMKPKLCCGTYYAVTISSEP